MKIMECFDYRQYLKKYNKVVPIKKKDCTIQTYQLEHEFPKFIQQVNNNEKVSNEYQMI